MSKPVVLFVSHDASRSGAPLCLGELLSSFASNEPGFEPLVFVRGEGPLLPEWRATGLHIVSAPRCELDGLAGKLVNRLLSVFAYVRLMHRVKPRLVYSNTIINNIEVIIGRVLGSSTMVHVHEGEALMRRHAFMMRISSRFTSKYVCVSHYCAKALHGITGADSVVVHNGISGINRGSPTTRGTTKSKFVMGIVGGIQPNKGHHVALAAIAKLAFEHGRPTYLRIFGETEDIAYRRRLESLTDQLGIQSYVQFCGASTDRESIYQSIDALLLTSFDESFGRVILEAFVFGKPVIASAVGGVPEIITNEENGLLFEAGNPEKLASTLRRILDEPNLASRLATNAAKDVQLRFRLEDTILRLRAEIERLLANNRSRH